MHNLILHPALEKELTFLLNNPSKVPPILCFHSVPAQGKTVFAKYLADELAGDVSYFDANLHLTSKNDYSYIAKEISYRSGFLAVDSNWSKHFKRCFIIDEWHNFTDVRQDSYKVLFDEVSERNCLIIICCNTTQGRPINKTLTDAIYSRCHTINFNITRSQVAEVAAMAKENFPMLSDDFINKSLPDWRVIHRKVQMKT